MTAHRNGYGSLDEVIAAYVHAAIASDPNVTVSGIAEKLNMRRATLSTRVNGHAPFSPSLLSEVAGELGTTASAIIARAETAVRSPKAEAA